MPHAVVLDLAGEKRPRYLDRYAHGLFFELLVQLDPDLARKLHEAPRKPFTLSPLPERGGIFLRFTFLDDALFNPFLEALLDAAPKGLILGEDRVILKRVFATPEGHPMAGSMGWETLQEAPAKREIQLRFLTPTVFKTSKPGKRTRYTPLPEPRLIMNSLLEKWQQGPLAYSPKTMAALKNAFDLDAEVAYFRQLRFHRIQAGKSFFPGFTGVVGLKVHSESPEVQKALGRLERLAFFSGIGAKTPYGMGLAVPVDGRLSS